MLRIPIICEISGAIPITSDIDLYPCKVCGKIPKVYRDPAYETAGYGAWCTVRCKPLFRKSHCTIESGKSTWDRAFADAINRWNQENGLFFRKKLKPLDVKENYNYD